MSWLLPKAASAPPAIPLEIKPVHPYYPIGVDIANYVANDRDVLTMLTQFFLGWVVILGTTWVVMSKALSLKLIDKLALTWFVLTGTIHLFFEGYFAYNHKHMGPAQDLFGQLWKEYALSDSRYLYSEPFVLCMETCTAFLWGPLSYLTVYLICKSNPYRFPVQAIVCMGQIYGLILYYATSMFDLYYKGLEYCRPEAYYFWFYFFFMNFIWFVIPGLLLYQSVIRTAQAFTVMNNVAKASSGNGVVKTPKANKQIKGQ